MHPTNKFAQYFFSSNNQEDKSPKSCIISAPFDSGVRKNGGRAGSRFAPKAILYALGNMITHLPEEERWIFCKTLKTMEEDFSKELMEFPVIGHIGGGHENIYSLLTQVSAQNPKKKLWVINIDAHCDTRVDSATLHSGNPFRLFDLHYKRPWNLIQLGINTFANQEGTLGALSHGVMDLYPHFPRPNYLNILENLNIGAEDLVLLSLDADALAGHLMEGVSAVNPHGLEINDVLSILNWYTQHRRKQQKIFGIYEMNPIYDNLSQKSARPLALFIYHYITSSICALSKL